MRDAPAPTLDAHLSSAESRVARLRIGLERLLALEQPDDTQVPSTCVSGARASKGTRPASAHALQAARALGDSKVTEASPLWATRKSVAPEASTVSDSDSNAFEECFADADARDPPSSDEMHARIQADGSDLSHHLAPPHPLQSRTPPVPPPPPRAAPRPLLPPPPPPPPLPVDLFPMSPVTPRPPPVPPPPPPTAPKYAESDPPSSCDADPPASRIEKKLDQLHSVMTTALSLLQSQGGGYTCAPPAATTESCGEAWTGRKTQPRKDTAPPAQVFDARAAMLDELRKRIESRKAGADEGAVANF